MLLPSRSKTVLEANAAEILQPVQVHFAFQGCVISYLMHYLSAILKTTLSLHLCSLPHKGHGLLATKQKFEVLLDFYFKLEISYYLLSQELLIKSESFASI